jgi:hypothetical protein
MSITDEWEVQDLTREAGLQANLIATNENAKLKAQDLISKADSVMKKNIQDVFRTFSLETIISFAETALKIPDRGNLSKEYLDMFFKTVNNKGQFLIRALILKATLKSMEADQLGLKAMGNVQNAREAIKYIFEAIKIIAKGEETGGKKGGSAAAGAEETRRNYSFLIYNISLCVYNIVRPFFRKGWLNHFLDIIEEIDKLLESVEEPNYDWRARFAWVLFNCTYDADKKVEAYKIFDKLWENSKNKKEITFQETLLRHRIHFAKENPAALSSIDKEVNNIQICPPEKGLKYLVELQKMKSGIIQDTGIEKELHKLLYAISPQILTSEETISNTKLTPILQERLAEAARVAIHFNLISIADKILNFLQRIRQTSQKTYIWIEYSKAEILVKKGGNNIDPKTGIRLNQNQMREQEIERRKEALMILEKTMSTNRRLNDPDLIYEGCVLIWNIGLPFVNENFKEFIVEPFLKACELLEDIHSTDHEFRVKLHMELAKIYMQDNHKKKAENHIQKALRLDYSLPEKLAAMNPPSAEDDPSQYQRVYDRYLTFMEQKIKDRLPHTTVPLEKVLDLLEAAQADKQGSSARDANLHEALSLLINMPNQPYVYDPNNNLVADEIAQERRKYNFQQVELYKRKKLLIGTIVKLAFKWKIQSLVYLAGQQIVDEEWNPKNAKEMIANQIETLHILAQTKIMNLTDDNVEPAFQKIIPIDPKKDLQEATEEKKATWQKMKTDIIDFHLKALNLINSIQQNWMIFNGAISIWNSYLMTFKNPLNDERLLPEIVKLLQAYFEAMKNSIKDIEKKMLADYDIDSKIQVYGNMGIILARLLEGQGKFDEVLKVSETLLLAPLSPHTRKLVNSIKARVSTSAKGGSKAAAAPAKGAAPGAPGQQNQGQNNNDQILFKVVNELEIIQNNTNKAQTPTLIKQCFDSLSTWRARDNDETDLELHAELWTKLSKLALNDQSTLMYKYSLRCIENALSMLNDDIDLSSIPTNRLRWYSLAEYLYAETLCRMVNPETQETESQETIYLHALNHVLQAANKGSKARNFQLVVDAAKKFWVITSKLKAAYTNRKILLKPIFSLLYYLKIVKDESFNDDFVLNLLNVLNQGCMENEEWALGETAADMCLELVPSNYKKNIWNWKMVFMSKQGKDELSIMNNIKECDPFLQAKVWLKLARTATQATKQYMAFSNAIEVLKKEESVGIVPVLIEFSEWLLRNKYDIKIVRENLLMASDILLEIEEAEEDEIVEASEDSQAERQTIFSRSSRGKKSVFSKFSSNDPLRKRDPTVAASSSNASRIQKRAAGSESRLNKASKRDDKTITTDNQKLINAQNDEENFDGRLNIKHFDQLLRIHVMLALVSENAESQIQYNLDAKFFMMKILEMTYTSLNNLKEIQEMVAKEEDKKNQTQQPEKKNLVLPITQAEWITFEFPQELISRIQTNYESNMFCKFVFEFPELTLYYLEQVLTDLELFGLHVHCVPIFKFCLLLADKVIQNKYLVLGLQLRFARCISSLGYTTEARELVVKVFPQISVSTQDFTNRYNELMRMRVEVVLM